MRGGLTQAREFGGMDSRGGGKDRFVLLQPRANLLPLMNHLVSGCGVLAEDPAFSWRS
jgi:hypothetical protein